MSHKKMVLGVLAGSLIWAAPLMAQPGGVHWRGGGGWGPGSGYGRMYDPNTVETVTGDVVSVDQITPQKGMSSGVHLTLKTDKGNLDVHLGPSWYIENQDVKIQAGDRIKVMGSRVTFDGKPAIIAAEVGKGDEVLKLRDGQGVPAWAGWRRYQQKSSLLETGYTNTHRQASLVGTSPVRNPGTLEH